MAPRPVSRASLRANLEDDPERDNMTPDMKRLSYSSRLDPKHLEEMQREIEDRPRFKESLRPKILVLPEPLDPRYRVRKKIENGEDLDESDWVVIEEEMRLEDGEEAPTLMVERRPVGKLFGRSLMDDIERRHAVRKERNK
ncbi:hypothetical protein BT69DRAFT_1287559 [Atractiella rhizophila]|nr:hypothetical protein BT69DRAFT_1287559 [Atractiella rhizophila]